MSRPWLAFSWGGTLANRSFWLSVSLGPENLFRSLFLSLFVFFGFFILPNKPMNLRITGFLPVSPFSRGSLLARAFLFHSSPFM
jgi:hypothetical protein